MSATTMTVAGVNGRISGARAVAAVNRAIATAPDPAAIRRLESLMETVSDEPLFKDNAVRLLVDGPATYDAMLESIDAARRHVNLETYIFNADEVGERFAQRLIAKRAEGVEVRVVYDSVGSITSETEFFERMKDAGVELVEFNPVNPLNGGDPLEINVRDHRKILVVDGQVAFTGGINLDRNYSSNSWIRRGPKRQTGWRDTHIELRGPAVAGFQRLFLRNWEESGGAAVGDDGRFYPKPRAHGHDLVRVLSATGGDGEMSAIRIAYGSAMDAAARSLWITQSYFAPDPAFLSTMAAAARRGVDVRILVAGVSDAPLLLHLSRACYGELLRAGVRVFESDDFILHAKTAVIDGVWSTVGSSNLDYRSFIHNHEANAVVLSESFGRKMEELFLSDLDRSREIRPREWTRRPLFDRAKELAGSLAQYWL
jgi:cardiolipin synthase